MRLQARLEAGGDCSYIVHNDLTLCCVSSGVRLQPSKHISYTYIIRLLAEHYYMITRRD
jgi:hypothetical protein